MNKITVITGHYGCGKTNFSVNLALRYAKSGEKVTVIDLDIVNPYFRTADFDKLFEENGIRLVAPEYANSNLDIPSFGFDLMEVSDGHVIIDLGGDDAGAVAVGRFADELIGSGREYDVLYLFNSYRYLTRTAAEAEAVMREIESASRLKITGLVNSSNLGSETTAETVLDSLETADELSALTSVPIVFTLSSVPLGGEAKKAVNLFPVDIYVRPPWERDSEGENLSSR